MTDITDKEKIEKLQEMIGEGMKMLDAAAQYAGENNIPLKYIDDYYDEEEKEDDEEDYDYGYGYEGPKLRFGGQGFELLKSYNSNTFRWHNSNC